MLIIHSLVSKSYILDLLPNNSMVAFLIGEGFDVYMLDWEPAQPADAENTLETYVDHYIPAAVAAACMRSRRGRTPADGVLLRWRARPIVWRPRIPISRSATSSR